MTITAAELSLLQASRLRERRAATRADARPVPELTRAWRDDALVDDGTHAAYLAGQLLDGDDLVALLAGDAWTPRAASADWLARVDPWLVHTPVSAEAYAPANGHLVVEDTRVAGLPFAALLGPMVGAQRAHLDGRPWLSRTARADLLDGLAERLATLSLRALLAELARDPAPGRHARLDAGSPTPRTAPSSSPATPSSRATSSRRSAAGARTSRASSTACTPTTATSSGWASRPSGSMPWRPWT